MIALNRNVGLCDIETYLLNQPVVHGITRSTKLQNLPLPFDAKHVFIVDDSIHTGNTMNKTRSRLQEINPSAKVTFGAIYAAKLLPHMVDVVFETVSGPRVFEWNVMHIPSVEKFCFDIDGVLCRDPGEDENDDAEAYLNFLENVQPLAVPTHEVGYLVTSRLEKYRKQTERWLKEHNIRYKELHMLDLPDAKTRRRLGCHASFKGGIYRKISDSPLFIESEPHQARKVAEISGKIVLCYTTQEIYQPVVNLAYTRRASQHFFRRALNKLKRELGGFR
jgi:uncharacterized HAD superfamily protein